MSTPTPDRLLRLCCRWSWSRLRWGNSGAYNRSLWLVAESPQWQAIGWRLRGFIIVTILSLFSSRVFSTSLELPELGSWVDYTKISSKMVANMYIATHRHTLGRSFLERLTPLPNSFKATRTLQEDWKVESSQWQAIGWRLRGFKIMTILWYFLSVGYSVHH